MPDKPMRNKPKAEFDDLDRMSLAEELFKLSTDIWSDRAAERSIARATMFQEAWNAQFADEADAE